MNGDREALERKVTLAEREVKNKVADIEKLKNDSQVCNDNIFFYFTYLAISCCSIDIDTITFEFKNELISLIVLK